MGEYSALREFKRRPEFFRSTFVDPNSAALIRLSNRSNFIILGKKGSGKFTYCLHMSEQLQREGYRTEFLSFNDEITADDVRDVVTVQHVDLKELVLASNIFGGVSSLYDFREIWKRRVVFSIHSIFESAGIRNALTGFVRGNFQNSSLIEGINRGLLLARLITSGDASAVADQVIPASRRDVPRVQDFNRVALELITQYKPKLYFFFDELNLSKTSVKDDEFDLRLALVRDIVKASTELNDFFVERGVDVHCVCSLRPEVRDALVRNDAEMSKLLDSCAVSLRWGGKVSDRHPLIEIMQRKTVDAFAEVGVEKTPREIFPDLVTGMFGDTSIPLSEYALNLTWFRPRDIVRLLKTYQSTNGNRGRFFDGDMHRFLKEYSRVSAVEALAELSVKYGSELLDEFRTRVKARYYSDLDELYGEMQILSNRLDLDGFISDLFQSGVILNHDHIDGKPVFYASYREDDRLDPGLRIMIHRGLWDYFHLLTPRVSRT